MATRVTLIARRDTIVPVKNAVVVFCPPSFYGVYRDTLVKLLSIREGERKGEKKERKKNRNAARQALRHAHALSPSLSLSPIRDQIVFHFVIVGTRLPTR